MEKSIVTSQLLKEVLKRYEKGATWNRKGVRYSVVYSGLCRVFVGFPEEDALRSYLKKNKPYTGKVIVESLFRNKKTCEYYVWEVYKAQPRINWLKKHIKRLERKGL